MTTVRGFGWKSYDDRFSGRNYKYSNAENVCWIIHTGRIKAKRM